MLHSVAVGYQNFRGSCHFHVQGEVGGSMVLRNVDILVQHCYVHELRVTR